MSRKHLLLNLLALSCLANGGINALEVSKAAPAKGFGVSVPYREDSAPTEVANKNKGNFLIEHKNDFMIGGLSALTGAAAGGGFGYWLGGRNKVSDEELSKANAKITEANAKITELEQKLHAFSNAQSTIDQLKNEKQTLQNELNAEKQKVSTLQSQLESLQPGDDDQGQGQRISLLTNKVIDLTKENNDLKTELTTLKEKIDQLKERDAELYNELFPEPKNNDEEEGNVNIVQIENGMIAFEDE